MAKAIGINAIKLAPSYTFWEASPALNAASRSVHNWLRTFLPSLREDCLAWILGNELQRWLKVRAADKGACLAPHEFFCLRCKMLKLPYGGMADCRAQIPHKLRLPALCANGEGFIYRTIRVLPLRAFIDPK